MESNCLIFLLNLHQRNWRWLYHTEKKIRQLQTYHPRKTILLPRYANRFYYNGNVIKGDEFKSLICTQKWTVFQNCSRIANSFQGVFVIQQRKQKIKTIVFCKNAHLETLISTLDFVLFRICINISVLKDFSSFLTSSINKCVHSLSSGKQKILSILDLVN